MTIYVDPATRPARVPIGEDPDDEKPPKHRDPLWAKLCLIIGALVMIASGALVVVPKVAAAWFTDRINKEDLLPPGLRGTNIDGPINILMIGMDERKGTGNLILSDTIIIAHIPESHDAVYMVSIPRDSKVEIPPFPDNGYRGGTDKINAAFAIANEKDGRGDPSPEGRKRGVFLTAHTISNLVPGGLTFNAVAIINFDGFQNILNAIGGVHMCVDERVTSIHRDRNGEYHTFISNMSQRKVYEVGCRDFAGWEALDYARQRYNVVGGDYGRQRHQQQLLMAIFKKLASKGVMTDIGKMTELQKVAGDLLTVDLGPNSIENWAFTLRNIRPSNVVMIKTNAGKVSPDDDRTTSYEILTEDSLALLRAVKDDTVFEFLGSHQDWIAAEK